MKKIISFSLIFLIIIIGISIGAFFLILNINPEDKEDIEDNRIQFEICSKTIDDFAYWLQDINVETIKESRYDLFIIDYSSDGTEIGEWSISQINYMKSSGDKEKLLISYISIGEAENYRFYWNDNWDFNQDGIPDYNAPDWLGEENPEWEGNYKVKYWNHDWQEIILNYLDRIIKVGFNGIYLDIIDAYEYYEDKIQHADWLMIDFVVKISNYVKNQVSENFAVLVQNGDELLLNSTYLNCIDGIGREDLFYMDDKATDDIWREEGKNNLNKAFESNKAILIIDYPIFEENIYDFYQDCIINDYLPYATERDLNVLKIYSFYPPT